MIRKGLKLKKKEKAWNKSDYRQIVVLTLNFSPLSKTDGKRKQRFNSII